MIKRNIVHPSALFLALCGCVTLLLACEPFPSASALTLEQAWVRAMPPGTKMTAAYGIFANHGTETVDVTAFSSSSFAGVSLHSSFRENGISKMKQQDGLSLAPGESVVLEPGGLHLMLMGPERELQTGDTVILEVLASNGTQYRFSLPLERR